MARRSTDPDRVPPPPGALDDPFRLTRYSLLVPHLGPFNGNRCCTVVGCPVGAEPGTEREVLVVRRVPRSVDQYVFTRLATAAVRAAPGVGRDRDLRAGRQPGRSAHRAAGRPVRGTDGRAASNVGWNLAVGAMQYPVLEKATGWTRERYDADLDRLGAIVGGLVDPRLMFAAFLVAVPHGSRNVTGGSSGGGCAAGGCAAGGCAAGGCAAGGCAAGGCGGG